MPLAKAAGKISIHAPREGERPWVRIPGRKWPSDFNPRSPRGGATCPILPLPKLYLFQSTLPTRGSDGNKTVVKCKEGTISIHAPHEGERLDLSGIFGAI